jgi:hypothetical protein
MAVVCSSLMSYPPGMLLRYFLNDSEVVRSVPIITGITLVCRFQVFILLLLLLVVVVVVVVVVVIVVYFWKCLPVSCFVIDAMFHSVALGNISKP